MSKISFKIEISFFETAKGIIICGYTLTPCLATFIAAVKIAFPCISVISGLEIHNLQPLLPNIGFNSCKVTILFLIKSSETLISSANSLISLSVFGKNSWSGGSNNLIVTGYPSIILNKASKSPVW